MEPPSKRPRLGSSTFGPDDDDDEEDELSMAPAQFDATQDPMYQLDKGRAKAATRLKSTFEDIFAKYGKDFEGDDDVINFYTDEIEIDNGHVESMESRDEDTNDASHSGDEEEISSLGQNGKPGRRKPWPTNSVIPLSDVRPSQMPPFQSPWGEPPGLITHQRSSLSFPPFGVQPPFSFGSFGFPPLENSSIDPVWQAPDLPIQAFRQQGSLNLYGEPNQAARRRVTAKSFLRLRAAAASAKTSKGGATEEEDDILVGGNDHDELKEADMETPEKNSMPADTGTSSQSPKHSPVQQPPLHEIDTAESEPLQKKISNPRKRAFEIAASESLIEGITSEYQGIVPDKARQQDILSPLHLESMQHAKTDSPLDRATENGSRPLQPHERRIEIIIHPGKQLPSVQDKEIIEDTESVVGEVIHQMTMEENDSIRGVYSAQTVRPVPAPGTTDRPQKTPTRRRGRPRKMQKQIAIFATDTGPHVDESLNDTFTETVEVLESFQTVIDGTTNSDITNDLRKIQWQSDVYDQYDTSALVQQDSLALTVDADEEQTVYGSCAEEVAEKIDTMSRSPERLSPSFGSPVREEYQDATDQPDLSDPTMIKANPSIIMIPQEPESSYPEYEDNLYAGIETSCSSPYEEMDSPIYSHWLIDSATFDPDQPLEDVFISSDEPDSQEEAQGPIPQPDIELTNPQSSPTTENEKSNLCLDGDSPSNPLETLETYEKEAQDISNQLLSTAPLDDANNDPQPDEDHLYDQWSPILGAIDLPDLDLSAFPTALNDTNPTPELPQQLASDTIRDESETDTTHDEPHADTETNRAPSPELGTPVGFMKSQTASPTKASPLPTTPTRKRGLKSAKQQSSQPLQDHYNTPSSKRFPLSSLLPGTIDDEDDDSEDEISVVGSFYSSRSRTHRHSSPFSFSRTPRDSSPKLPPPPPFIYTPCRGESRKQNGTLPEAGSSSPSKRIIAATSGRMSRSNSKSKTPSRGVKNTPRIPPATDSRAGRSGSSRGRRAAAAAATGHSSPLSRRVARLLLDSSPTKQKRRCGDDGFVCDRAFCLTCCK